MSLKYRIFIIFSLLIFFFLAVDYGIQRLVILPTYLALEEEEVKQNLDRALEAIHREIEHINILCYDWASWDDTYDFIVTGSERYIKSNLSFSTFKSNNLNLIYYCDPNGNVVWQATYDVTNGWEIRISNILERSEVRRHLLSFPGGGARVKKGLVNTNHGIMMLASRPILPSSDQGDPRGTLIMGTLLDSALIRKLTSQTRVDFNIISLHDPNVRQPYRAILSHLTSEGAYHIEKIDKEEIKAYALMKDIEENPALLISLNFPREISKQGIKTIHFAIFYILGVGALVLILFLLFTNTMILIPLSRLTGLLKEVEETGDLSIRSSMERTDEIGQLSRRFNRMMGRMQQQNHDLAAAMDELTVAMKAVKKLATIDALTELANRRYFEEVIQKEWKRAVRDRTAVSVILCDIDYFKCYNDTYGHQKGDECLKSVAQVIGNGCRRPSDLAARYGGEEFILLLPNVDEEGAYHVAEKIRKDVENLAMEHTGSGIGEHLSISLGVATLYPGQDDTYEALIDCADQALYLSKDRGRNRVTVYGKSLSC